MLACGVPDAHSVLLLLPFNHLYNAVFKQKATGPNSVGREANSRLTFNYEIAQRVHGTYSADI